MSAGRPAPPPDTPHPPGTRLRPAPGTRRLGPDLWFGGSPARVVRLRGDGPVVLERLLVDGVDGPRAGRLARRLTDVDLALPVPPGPPPGPSRGGPGVTVVVPTRDRAAAVSRCLAALGREHPVVVVDDGSTDPAAVAAVAARHGATLVRRPVNGGPGAARATGLAAAAGELVAFVDSDVVVPPGWLAGLVPHLADPLVAAVAPRVVPLARDTAARRYAAVNGALDLGPAAARVRPGARVSYVPTAALLVRRAAVLGLAAGFDPALRVGEDVDLVWRLDAAGWRVRYEPAVEVGHDEPARWRALLARRARYGTSAGPLARRHPGALAPLVVHPWPAAAAVAALARRPLLAGALAAAGAAATARDLRRAGVPTAGLARATAGGVWHTGLGLGRWLTQAAAPALVLAAAWPGAPATRRRGAALALLLAPPLAARARTRGAPGRLPAPGDVAARLADDVAYGAGVWWGCLRARTAAPLLPRVVARGVGLPRGPGAAAGPRAAPPPA